MTNETAVPTDKLDFKKIFPILVIVLVDLLGLTIIIPLLPYYATSFGADPTTIGFLAATYPFFQLIGAPVLGRLSDRYGRKPILVISQFGTLVGFIILGLAGSLWVLFLSRIIDGMSGANIATAQAAIADSTTEKNRTQGLGLIGAAFGLGFVIGPVIAFVALALSGNNYAVPAFVAAAFSLSSIFLTVFWFTETLPAEKRGTAQARPSLSFRSMLDAVRHPIVGFLLLLVFSYHLAFGGFESLFALFTLTRLGFNSAGNAILFTFVGIILVAVQGGLVGKWSRRYGDRRLVFAGLGLLSVGMLLIGLTPKQPAPWYSQTQLEEELTAQDGEAALTQSTAVADISVPLPDDANRGWLGLFWLLLAIVPVAVGAGILQPTLNSLLTKRVDPSEIGGILGISSAFLSAANVAGPIIAGVIFQAAGATTLFVLWGVMLAVLLATAVRYLKPVAVEAV